MRTLGRTDDAVADYRRALELNPDERTRRAAEAGLSELRAASGKPGTEDSPVTGHGRNADTLLPS